MTLSDVKPEHDKCQNLKFELMQIVIDYSEKEIDTNFDF